MKKAFLFACLPGLFLFGCASFATFVENPGEYEAIPIKSGPLFSKKTLVMGEYNLRTLKKSSSSSNTTFGTGQSFLPTMGPATRKARAVYETYRENTRIDRFEINMFAKGMAINSSAPIAQGMEIGSSTTIAQATTYLSIMGDSGAVTVEINPNRQPVPSMLFTLSNSNISLLWSAEETSFTVTRYHKNTQKTDPAGTKGAFGIPVISGLLIEVNGEEYGILALAPKMVFHKKRAFNNSIDAAYGDKLISYMLVAYEALRALEP